MTDYSINLTLQKACKHVLLTDLQATNSSGIYHYKAGKSAPQYLMCQMLVGIFHAVELFVGKIIAYLWFRGMKDVDLQFIYS